MKKIMSVKQQVGLFGDLIEGIAIKFIAGLIGIEPKDLQAMLPAIIALIKWIVGKFGVKEAIKVVAFIGKNPSRVYQSVATMMAEGK